uniref:Uncharacterized protein n=1 Tax=Hyaloperonospora arabidopsidis (strain Emoy2) TaxID=559515 RepID=M4BDT1_HYAAE
MVACRINGRPQHISVLTMWTKVCACIFRRVHWMKTNLTCGWGKQRQRAVRHEVNICMCLFSPLRVPPRADALTILSSVARDPGHIACWYCGKAGRRW